MKIRIKSLIEKVEAMHPYKVKGNYDTYNSYNEGWSDACNTVLSEIEKQLAPKKTSFEAFKFFMPMNGFILLIATLVGVPLGKWFEQPEMTNMQYLIEFWEYHVGVILSCFLGVYLYLKYG